MAFSGWPIEAVEFYEGLAANNSKTYWESHKFIYTRCVAEPMVELLAELADEFGQGRVFRPYRDVRFSKDKTPYKLNCAAHVQGGYLSFSAEELLVGSGLYVPDQNQLQQYRAAVDAERSGTELISIAAELRVAGYDVGASEVLKTAPKGYARDHPRIELLNQKGIFVSKSWVVGAWTNSGEAKERVIAALKAARPLNAWLERLVH